MNAETVQLNPGKIAERLFELEKAPVLSTDDACRLVGRHSKGAFYAWAARWKVRAFRPGYYLREDLLAALNREKRARGRP